MLRPTDLLEMGDRERFQQQKAWADSHLNEVNRVIRQLVGKIIEIHPTDPERDRRYGIDYEVKVVGGNVACRIRRADRYNFRDLTITTRRPSGVTPEVTKILDGSVRWYLYAWASQGRFIDWMFVDLDQVRALRLIENSIEQAVRSQIRKVVCLHAFRLRSLETAEHSFNTKLANGVLPTDTRKQDEDLPWVSKVLYTNDADDWCELQGEFGNAGVSMNGLGDPSSLVDKLSGQMITGGEFGLERSIPQGRSPCRRRGPVSLGALR